MSTFVSIAIIVQPIEPVYSAGQVDSHRCAHVNRFQDRLLAGLPLARGLVSKPSPLVDGVADRPASLARLALSFAEKAVVEDEAGFHILYSITENSDSDSCRGALGGRISGLRGTDLLEFLGSQAYERLPDGIVRARPDIIAIWGNWRYRFKGLDLRSGTFELEKAW
jgi:hypothetical protein